MKKLCCVFLFLLLVPHLAVTQNSKSEQVLKALLAEAKIMSDNANYTEAQAKYLEILRRVEDGENPSLLVQAQRGVAVCLYRLRDRENAAVWFKKALDNANKYQINDRIADLYYCLSVINVETGKITEAEKYFKLALDIWLKEKNYLQLSQAYSVIADLYLHSGHNYVKAEQAIKEAERFAFLSKDRQNMAFAAIKRYFLIVYRDKNYKAALPIINKAEKLYEELNDTEGKAYAYSLKATCLAKMGDTLAASYFWKWFYFKDSVFQKEKAVSAAKFEATYNVEKKEKENRILQEQAKNQKLIIIIMVFLVLVLITSVLLLFWRRKQRYTADLLNASQKENEANLRLIKEKERISRDLHDNVGAQLSFLITSLEWILSHPELVKDRSELEDKLKVLGETGKSAVTTLRETIWAISHDKFFIEDLADRFKQYVLKVVEFKDGVTVTFDEDINVDLSVSPTNALNLFRICQEAFHNALKHSRCENIVIGFSSNKQVYKISIKDDGLGFDTSVRAEGHYGLVNMKERAKDINAECVVESRPGKGTCVEIIVHHEKNSSGVLS